MNEVLKHIETCQIALMEIGLEITNIRKELREIKDKDERQQKDIWASLNALHKEKRK